MASRSQGQAFHEQEGSVMRAYPSRQFELGMGERARILALAAALLKTADELPKRMLFSLAQCERGNATLAAWDSWCSASQGYAGRIRREMTELDAAYAKPRERARRILSKRIRRNPQRKSKQTKP